MAAEADIDLYDAIEEDFSQEQEDDLLNGGTTTSTLTTVIKDETADLYDDVLTATVKTELKEEVNGRGDHGDEASNDGSTTVTPATELSTNTQNKFYRRWQVYISNLTWWTNDIDVTQACNAVGVTDMVDIKFYENRANGQSRGFCTVSVQTPESMNKLMEKIKTVQIHSQTLNVHYCNRQNLMMLDAATGGNRAEVEQDRDRQYHHQQHPPQQHPPQQQNGPPPQRFPPRMPPRQQFPGQPGPGGPRPPMMMGPRGPMPGPGPRGPMPGAPPHQGPPLGVRPFMQPGGMPPGGGPPGGMPPLGMPPRGPGPGMGMGMPPGMMPQGPQRGPSPQQPHLGNPLQGMPPHGMQGPPGQQQMPPHSQPGMPSELVSRTSLDPISPTEGPEVVLPYHNPFLEETKDNELPLETRLMSEEDEMAEMDWPEVQHTDRTVRECRTPIQASIPAELPLPPIPSKWISLETKKKIVTLVKGYDSCRACGYRTSPGRIMFHTKQHHLRFFCTCQFQRASRDGIYDHQRQARRKGSKDHGSEIYEVDEENFLEFVQAMKWDKHPKFGPCIPNARHGPSKTSRASSKRSEPRTSPLQSTTPLKHSRRDRSPAHSIQLPTSCVPLMSLNIPETNAPWPVRDTDTANALSYPGPPSVKLNPYPLR